MMRITSISVLLLLMFGLAIGSDATDPAVESDPHVERQAETSRESGTTFATNATHAVASEGASPTLLPEELQRETYITNDRILSESSNLISSLMIPIVFVMLAVVVIAGVYFVLMGMVRYAIVKEPAHVVGTQAIDHSCLMTAYASSGDFAHLIEAEKLAQHNDNFEELSRVRNAMNRHRTAR